MTIKLGVAGTHSTGKTSFLDALSESLQGKGLRVGRVTDVAREARDAGFPILRDHTFESTLWIMTRCINKQLQLALANDVVLVDRPALDAVGYLWAALETRGQRLSWREEQTLVTLAQQDAASYPRLFRTQLDPSIPLGPGRDPDLAFRKSAAAHIATAFERLELTYELPPPELVHVAEIVGSIVATVHGS